MPQNGAARLSERRPAKHRKLLPTADGADRTGQDDSTISTKTELNRKLIG
jgi:hypothetical protein